MTETKTKYPDKLVPGARPAYDALIAQRSELRKELTPIKARQKKAREKLEKAEKEFDLVDGEVNTIENEIRIVESTIDNLPHRL